MHGEPSTGKHVLFLPYPSHGHVTPTLAVARELVRRGHRVTYAVTPAMSEVVSRVGASVIHYGTSLMSSVKPPQRWTDDALGRAFLQYITEITGTTSVIEERLRDDRPDVIAYDSTVWAPGRVLGRKWSLPTVQLLPVFASNDAFSLMKAQVDHGEHPTLAEDDPVVQGFKDLVRDFFSAHGLDKDEYDSIIAGKNERSLVFLPRSFQPFGESFGDDHDFVGPCLDLESVDMTWRPPDRTTPVIFVSLGTMSNDQPAFFRACADAFADLPWHVVVSVGNELDDEELAAFPSNFEVHRWIPYPAVLRHATVLVSQAGMGGIMQAGHYATPLVAIPFQPEPRVNADRLAELGLGRRIDPADVTPELLRETVLAVANDDAVRENMRRFRDDIANAGGASRAADLIDELLGHAHWPAS